MVVKLSTFLSTSLADGLDSALVTGIIANTDVALDSGTTGNYIATITGGDGITVVNGAAHEADAIVRVDSATVATSDNTLTVTNKTFNLTNNTLTGTLGQFNAALNGATFASLDGGETLTNKTLTSPTINTPQIVGPGSFSKVTTLGLRDQTTNAFDLRVQSNSSTNLTDNRTLTVDVENVNRTVKLGGDLIIDKELRTAGDFNLLMNLTDSTNITLPTSGTVMQFDSNGASTITGAFSAGSLAGHYLGADSDVTELVTKAFVDNLGVDASTLGGRDSDYFLNYNNFTNTPAGSVALASLGVNAPSNPSNGQLWWDDSAGNLYVYYVDSDGDTQWVEAVPQLAAEDFFSTSGGTIAGAVTITSGKFNHRSAATDGLSNFALADNANMSTYATEGSLQIGAHNTGSWASHITLTNAPTSGTNNHWVIHHNPTTGVSGYADALSFRRQSTNTANSIGGDGAGTTALVLQSDGRAQFNGSQAGENIALDGRMRIHGSDYQQLKLSSDTNQGWAGIQFCDIISPTNGNNGLSDADQLGFLRFSHGDGLNQTVSGQSANAGYVFGSTENVNVISLQWGMGATSYGNNAGEIRFGSGVNTTYGTSSDRRIKENISSIDVGVAKTKILAMNPVTFNMINDPNETPVEHTGFIAQEMHEVMPEVVIGHGVIDEQTGDSATMSIDYSKLTPVLVSALQEALTKIDSLEARIATLEG